MNKNSQATFNDRQNVGGAHVLVHRVRALNSSVTLRSSGTRTHVNLERFATLQNNHQ